MKIKDAELLNQLTGEERIPVSNGSDKPTAVTINLILDKASTKNNLLIDINYETLKALRDSNQLIPGARYKIVDYETIVQGNNIQSAGHLFDLIVTAIDEKTLSEECKACHSIRDNYFSNNDLDFWKIWYTLDNDRCSWGLVSGSFIQIDLSGLIPYLGISTHILIGTTIQYEDLTLYKWSLLTVENTSVDIYTESLEPLIGDLIYFGQDTVIIPTDLTVVSSKQSNESGKGIIYRMIDEFDNDLPYDFKNVLYLSKMNDGYFDSEGEDVFVYTFSTVDNDYNYIDNSLTSRVFNNKLPLSNDLPYTIFLQECFNNTFKETVYDNKLTNCINNTILGTFSKNVGTLKNNDIHSKFINNQLRIFERNTIKVEDFLNNIIQGYFRYNNLNGYSFSDNNITSPYFDSNTINSSSFSSNHIVSNFNDNQLCGLFSNNTIRRNFTDNTCGSAVSFNEFYIDIVNNIFEGDNLNLLIGKGFDNKLIYFSHNTFHKDVKYLDVRVSDDLYKYFKNYEFKTLGTLFFNPLTINIQHSLPYKTFITIIDGNNYEQILETDYALKSEIPTKISLLENDSKYLIDIPEATIETVGGVKKFEIMDLQDKSNIDNLYKAYNTLVEQMINAGVAEDTRFVDLGLPSGTLWATCNLGSDSIDDPGLFFLWGDIEGYYYRDGLILDLYGEVSDKRFKYNQYKWFDGTDAYENGNHEGLIKYLMERDDSGSIIAAQTSLLPEDNAAINYKSNLNIPTANNVSELLKNTNKTYVEMNGRTMLCCESINNGNKLYFPKVGYIDDSQIELENVYFWPSYINFSNLATCLVLIINPAGPSDQGSFSLINRFCGLPIRPVKKV